MSFIFIQPPLCLRRPKQIALFIFLLGQHLQSVAAINAAGNATDNSSEQRSNIPATPILTKEIKNQKVKEDIDETADFGFNPKFLLQTGSKKIDINRFNKKNAILPGEYFVDLVVNGEKLGQANVNFKEAANKEDVYPCFNRKLLLKMKVNINSLDSHKKELLKSTNKDNSCLHLSDLIDKASANYNAAEQILNVSVPQANMKHFYSDSIDPALWSDGVNAALLQYRANFYKTKNNNGQQSQIGYLGLKGGINVGSWRFRHDGSLNYSDYSNGLSSSKYTPLDTYIQRSISSIKSQLSVGDLHSDGAVLDSFDFRGIQLLSDERMYPYSERGYLPVIHGIANSNAHVKISQNGSVLYETNVPSGPFVINDFHTSGYGGDLTVSVTESDGSVHISYVPYSAAPESLSEGASRYSILAGNYRDFQNAKKSILFQGVIQHGINNLVTAYGGTVVSKKYFLGTVGSAFNTRYGALGLDFSYSHLSLNDRTNIFGKSIRVSYSKFISPTNTNIDVSAYQFSSRNYLTLQDSMGLQNLNKANLFASGFLDYKQRSRFQTTISQNLGKYGSFSFVGSSQSYWGNKSHNYQYQFTYSRAFKYFDFNVSVSRNLSENYWQNSFMATLNIPLDSKYGSFFSSTSSNYNSSTKALSFNQGLSGTSGKNNNLSYGINFALNDEGSGNSKVRSNSIETHINYESSLSSINASFAHGNSYNQESVGAFGSLVAYGGGVVFSPYIGSDTLGIVETKGDLGDEISTTDGIKLNPSGLGMVPNLEPFASNNLGINIEGMPIGASLNSTSQKVIPTAGAIVLVQFKTKNTGRSAILQASMPNGDPVPFGADVFDEQGINVGSVAQGGLLALYGLKKDKGTLIIKWGEDEKGACSLSYDLPPKKKNNNRYHISSEIVCYNPSFVAKM